MTKIILIIILIFALFLRIFGISNHPPALNWDEVSQGYNAYSILKTGSDDWGQLPVTNFRAYGDYPTTFYLYTLVPIEAVFGLNEFSLRLPSVIFGTLLVLVIFYLAKQIFKDEKLALVAAFLMAISPWNFMLSRQAIQVIPALFLLATGILFWFKGVEKKYWYLVATLFFGLSTFAYHNTRIISPLILLVLIFLDRKVLLKNIKTLVSVLVIGAIFFIPVFFSIIGTEGSARATWVGILDQGAINRINSSRGASSLPGPLPRLVNNKVTYFLETTVINYIGYFSPQFLAINGGTQYQFNVPNFGLISLVELPFFYLGAVILIWKYLKIDKEKKLLLVLVLLAPIPAAITRDPYQVVRGAIMLIPVNLITILGIQKFVSLSKKQIFNQMTIAGVLILATLSFANYFYNYWLIYPKEYSQSWQYGYKQAVQYIEEHGSSYQTIYITKAYGEPHEFLLFYSQYDPAKYKSDPNLVRYFKTNWYWVDSFDKYRFLNDWEVKSDVSHQSSAVRSLLVTTPGNYPPGAKLLETINFLDGKPAFDIVELN